MSWTRPAALFLSIFMALCAAGCASLLPKRSVPPEGEIPKRFSLETTGVATNNRWWEDFESEELDALIDEALAENLTLRQLWARLAQSGARAVQAGSRLYPQVDLNADAGYRRTVSTVEGTPSPSLKQQLGAAVVNGVTQGISQGIGSALGTAGSTGGTAGQASGGGTSTVQVTRETKQFGLALAASYEVDIWGRIASGYRAAEYDAAASRNDLEATAITLTAEVTDRWLRILEQQALGAILQEQLETNRTYLELIELRFRKNKVSALDVYQQKQVVKEVEQQIPLVESREEVLRHDLAVLLGKPPTSDLAIGLHDLETVPPPPSAGIPADLLANRPDIRAALDLLNAADYRVAEARADRLPAIILSGGIGYNADDITNLFDDWFVNLAAGLTQPIFDGYRRRAEVERTLAVVEERLANYRLVVLNAVREVEDALVQEQKQREFITALTEELDAASNALSQASRRYQGGDSDYLPVLAALERKQFLTRDLVSARRELLVFRINLYRALGGTWTRQLHAPPCLSDEDALAEAVK